MDVEGVLDALDLSTSVELALLHHRLIQSASRMEALIRALGVAGHVLGSERRFELAASLRPHLLTSLAATPRSELPGCAHALTAVELASKAASAASCVLLADELLAALPHALAEHAILSSTWRETFLLRAALASSPEITSILRTLLADDADAPLGDLVEIARCVLL